MEPIKLVLGETKFRTRGNWYDCVQVDDFFDKISVLAEELVQSKEDLQQQVETLQAELKQARSEAQKKSAEPEKEEPVPEPEPESVPKPSTLAPVMGLMQPEPKPVEKTEPVQPAMQPEPISPPANAPAEERAVLPELSPSSELAQTLERDRRICKELEQERDELIESIRQLRSFREAFRKQVEQDSKQVLELLGRFASDQLL